MNSDKPERLPNQRPCNQWREQALVQEQHNQRHNQQRSSQLQVQGQGQHNQQRFNQSQEQLLLLGLVEQEPSQLPHSLVSQCIRVLLVFFKYHVADFRIFAASTNPGQVSPVTTVQVFSVIGGVTQQVPVVYTQKFSSFPSQGPTPAKGEIGLGTLTGKIGVVNTAAAKKGGASRQIAIGFGGMTVIMMGILAMLAI